MKNKENEKFSPVGRLWRYLLMLVGASTAFFGTVSVATRFGNLLALTVAYVISLFLAFTAFILAGMFRKTEHMTASRVVYCATVLINGISGGLLASLVCVWRSAAPDLAELAVCAGVVIIALALTSALTALIRKRGAIYAAALATLAAFVWVIKRLIELDFGNSFYLIAVFSLVFIVFRLMLCLFILSKKNFLRHDALLSFGPAIAVGAVALVIFSDGTPAETMIEVEGVEGKVRK